MKLQSIQSLHWFLAVAFLFAMVSCDSAASKVNKSEESEVLNAAAIDSGKLPEFSFVDEEYHFGEMIEGDVREHTFEFTNTGEIPLIISAAQGSCGCTVPDFPREPIAPGAKAEIHISFNSAGKSGNQEKTVTLTANTVPNIYVLKIMATVNPKK